MLGSKLNKKIVLNLFGNNETIINQLFNEIFICKTMFHPLRDPQLQFKSQKYKLNKNMEDIIKCNIKKIDK